MKYNKEMLTGKEEALRSEGMCEKVTGGMKGL